MNHDMSAHPVERPWMTTLVDVFPKTGNVKPNSMRVVRSVAPPPCTRDEGTPVPKFSGPLMRVKVLVAEAGAFWDLQPGAVVNLPAELAAPRLRDGRVRMARPDERLTAAAIE